MTGQGIHTNAWPILLASGLRIVSITVRFRVKWEYRSTIPVSVSSLISQLGWRTLSDRRRNSRLSFMYKSLHSLTGISTSPFRRPSKPTRSADSDTFCVLSSQIDPYKYSFCPRTIADWNALLASVKSCPSICSFRCAIRSSSNI